jgi:hypothetical protein
MIKIQPLSLGKHTGGLRKNVNCSLVFVAKPWTHLTVSINRGVTEPSRKCAAMKRREDCCMLGQVSLCKTQFGTKRATSLVRPRIGLW